MDHKRFWVSFCCQGLESGASAVRCLDPLGTELARGIKEANHSYGQKILIVRILYGAYGILLKELLSFIPGVWTMSHLKAPRELQIGSM